MRPAVKALAILAAYLAILAVLAIRYPQGVFAFKSGSPSTSTIEGNPVCAGPPTAGNLLGFNNGSWCDTVSPPTIISSYLNNPTGVAAGTNLTTWRQTVAGHVVDGRVALLVAPAGCTTAPVVGILGLAATNITLANGSSADAAPSINVAITGNSSWSVELVTIGVGCTTVPTGISTAYAITYP